jgi:hypothetical protein
MMLLTKAQREQLLDNGRRQAAVKGTSDEIDFRPVVKLFNPIGAATWLLTEIDPDDETVAWGLCDLGMGFPEFGTVSLDELAAYRGRFGLASSVTCTSRRVGRSRHTSKLQTRLDVSSKRLSRMTNRKEVFHEHLFHHSRSRPRLPGGDDAALWRGDAHELPDQP